MFRFGEKVVIRDGPKLDGSSGIAYSVKDGQVLVLIERQNQGIKVSQAFGQLS